MSNHCSHLKVDCIVNGSIAGVVPGNPQADFLQIFLIVQPSLALFGFRQIGRKCLHVAGARHCGHTNRSGQHGIGVGLIVWLSR